MIAATLHVVLVELSTGLNPWMQLSVTLPGWPLTSNYGSSGFNQLVV